MRTYYNVGTTTLITDYAKLDEFGQTIELPDDMPIEPSKGGPKILSEKNWNSIGFKPEELEQYRIFGFHPDAPEEFHEKKRRALALLHEPQHLDSDDSVIEAADLGSTLDLAVNEEEN